MGLVTFFLLVLITMLLAALTTWAIRTYASGTPALVINIIWGVAVLIVIVALAQALGLTGYNPNIPRLR